MLPLGAGFGAALALLLMAGGPARLAYAGTLTYPGCGTSIQDCIDSANTGDTILISAGDYTESLTLSKAVSLTGDLSSTTILHALPNTRALTVTGAAVDASVVISGLTFTGGNLTTALGCQDDCGGGIMITGTAQPQLENVILTDNSALNGGGLFNSGTATLTSSTITSNTAIAFGGGVFNYGTLTITGSTISNNTAILGDGGGVGNYGSLTISSSTITSNTITRATAIFGGGGGVFNNYGTVTITSSTIRNNTATYSGVGGGGVYNWGGTLTITSSTISNNTATLGRSGGGIFSNGTLTVTGSTISNNTATFGGGVLDGGNVAISRSSVSNNTANYGGGVYTFAGDSRIVNALLAGNSASQEGAALYLASPGSVAILYNTIASAPLDSGAAIVVTSGTVGITDTIIASYTTGISQTAGSVYQDYNLFFHTVSDVTGTVSGGGQSLSSNPAFADPAHDDYHITLASAARGKGIDVSVTTDFDGDPRPLHGGFDIGFDQYNLKTLFLPLVRR